MENNSANSRQIGGEHYKSGRAVEHWDFCWQNDYDFFQYCATKYIHRHKQKKGVEDLKKAIHYLEKYIELLENGKEIDRCPQCGGTFTHTGECHRDHNRKTHWELE